MSWIFGILRKSKQASLPRKGYYPLRSKKKFSVDTKDYYFSCGLGHKNSFYKYEEKKDSGWMVCGTGISYEEDAFHLMGFHDWEEFLKNKNSNIRGLNGHFVIVEWEQGHLRIRNDQLGMRDMFFADTKNFLAFSTRLDWLIPYIEEPEIDFEIFSSSWLCVNPLTYECFIKNVERLGPGGTARFEDNNFTKTHQPWLPEYALKLPDINYFDAISDLTTLGIKQNRKLLLGLSGGLDSRILLSILLQHKRDSWSTYSFGDKNFPDAIIAKRLSEKLGFSQSTISNLYSSKYNDVDRFNEFVLQTHTYMIGSLFYEQDHYRKLDHNSLLIDGGGGGYYRRILAKKLWLKGRQSIIDKNSQKIRDFIRNNKPNLFTTDVSRLMDYGCDKQIIAFLEKMPDIRTFGAGNWTDLFSIYTRSANIGSTTQTRLDGIIYNYMPLMQPSLLRWILSLPIIYRIKNKIYKNIILRNNNTATKQPLVKDRSVLPFTFNTYTTHIYEKISRKLLKGHAADYGAYFLQQNKEFVLSLAQSKGIKEFPAYNQKYIEEKVTNYYRGNTSLSNDVLWWLTFDVWRMKLQENRKKLDR